MLAGELAFPSLCSLLVPFSWHFALISSGIARN
jgi:hypothetical protein